MAKGIENFQYVGYLTDFLSTYNSIDALSDQYECAKVNFEAANQKLEEYKHTFSLKNCLCGWVFLFLISLLSFPILFIPHSNVIAWLAFCAILSCVIIVVSKIIYHKKVLPAHRATLEEEIRRSEQAYQKAYEGLIAQRTNLQDMRDGIDERCTYPLSVYIMLGAAKEGECANIPQGMRYFNNRYRTLETAEDDASVKLKASIDNEQAKAGQRQQFLDNLDESARTLFNS